MDTKLQILNAAEKLFARQGFEATSLRAIIADAQVNLAAVHYHFGSKEGLIRAVLERRLAPMNRERLRLLDSYEHKPGGKPPTINELLQAFLGPALSFAIEDSSQGHPTLQLMGRILLQSSEMLERAAGDQFRDLAGRFLKAFQRALPRLSKQEIAWKLNFTIGAAAKALYGGVPLKVLSEASNERLAEKDLNRILRRLISYTAAGMSAPVENEM